ncbi:MAG TPA: hypothetical protein VES40_21615 [Ilumatobacteraceae bacterium]|nr:hypothetical protein [Ilumatobacteraceae bacterium]
MMIAGAICEETDCTGLVLMILAIFAAFVIVTAVVAGAWAMTVSTVLRRRGWSAAPRRAVATLCTIGIAAVVWGVATGLSEVGQVLGGLIAVTSVPVAVWQRRVTRCALGVGEESVESVLDGVADQITPT